MNTRQERFTETLRAEMPVIRRVVIGAVLAHPRHRHPIGEGDAAKGQRFK
jgi:hypothetical protein